MTVCSSIWLLIYMSLIEMRTCCSPKSGKEGSSISFFGPTTLLWFCKTSCAQAVISKRNAKTDMLSLLLRATRHCCWKCTVEKLLPPTDRPTVHPSHGKMPRMCAANSAERGVESPDKFTSFLLRKRRHSIDQYNIPPHFRAL